MFDRRRLAADQRREMIIEAAGRLFAERGYHGVSLDEIAAEAGVTKPVVYDHPVSKGDLYAGLLERHHEELLAHIIEHLDAEGTLEERMRSALRTLFGWAREHPFAWRLLFSDDTTGDPHVASIHRRVQQRANREVAKRVLSGVQAEGADQVQRLEMAGEILGGATRSLIRWWHSHPEVSEEVLVDTLMKVVWSGMSTTIEGRRPTAG
jgi:AcrR family transcriptional regulator